MRIVITSPLASHDEQLVEKVRQLAAGGPITIFPDPWVEDAERFAQNLSESRLSARSTLDSCVQHRISRGYCHLGSGAKSAGRGVLHR
jgi:hypothetical protein